MKKQRIIIGSLLLSLCLSNIAYAQRGYWVEENRGIKSDWYYIDPDNSQGNRWIKDFGYWYYIDGNNKLVTEAIDKEHIFNDGSNKEIPYGALIEKNQVLCKEKTLGNCSYLEVKRENLEDFDKVIVMLHGLGGTKEAYQYYASEAASRGALVIVPELYGHEMDKVGDIPNIIVNTSGNIERILKKYKLKGDYELDVIGCSLGGMIGAYFTQNSTYKVDKLSMLISTVSFGELEHDIFFRKYKNNSDNGEADKEKVLKELKEIDISSFGDTEVKMYSTTSDYYMDYDKIKGKIAKLVEEGNKITQIKIDYEGHSVTTEEYIDSINWFCN